MPGSMAGSASSTTMTRLSVAIVRIVTEPSAVCTRPSRAIPNQDKDGGELVVIIPGAHAIVHGLFVVLVILPENVPGT
jgi:hypothetical protein